MPTNQPTIWLQTCGHQPPHNLTTDQLPTNQPTIYHWAAYTPLLTSMQPTNDRLTTGQEQSTTSLTSRNFTTDHLLLASFLCANPATSQIANHLCVDHLITCLYPTVGSISGCQHPSFSLTAAGRCLHPPCPHTLLWRTQRVSRHYNMLLS